MADYRIESDGTVVVYLSEKATKWVSEPKPAVGARLAFKTKSDTADFVEAMEAEGFTFEGGVLLPKGEIAHLTQPTRCDLRICLRSRAKGLYPKRSAGLCLRVRLRASSSRHKDVTRPFAWAD